MCCSIGYVAALTVRKAGAVRTRKFKLLHTCINHLQVEPENERVKQLVDWSVGQLGATQLMPGSQLNNRCLH